MKKIICLLLIFNFIQPSFEMNAQVTKRIKKTIPVYLPKNDPVYLAIKARLINDLMLSAKKSDPTNVANQSIAAKLKTLPEARQQYYQDLYIKSLQEYTEAVHFDFDMFMMLYTDLMKKDQKTWVNESDLRVQSIGGNKYAAELWEDLLLANSEAKAVAWAKEISKQHPGDDKETIIAVKATYARARKDIISGKQKRYNKIIAFLYTKEKDGSVLFLDPGQALLDLKESDIH